MDVEKYNFFLINIWWKTIFMKLEKYLFSTNYAIMKMTVKINLLNTHIYEWRILYRACVCELHIEKLVNNCFVASRIFSTKYTFYEIFNTSEIETCNIYEYTIHV